MVRTGSGIGESIILGIIPIVDYLTTAGIARTTGVSVSSGCSGVKGSGGKCRGDVTGDGAGRHGTGGSSANKSWADGRCGKETEGDDGAAHVERGRREA